MWLVFMIFTFPLTAFGTLGLRYCFVNNAVCYAAEAACQANTFSVNQDAQHLSAVNCAQAVMLLAQTSWHGISLVGGAGGVQTSIVIAPLISTNPVTTQTSVLTTAQMLQQNLNVYMIQVSANVSISPLIPQNFMGGPQIPGLNAPIVTTVIHQKFCESPSGLKS
jgi:hypothetical protein